MLRSISAVVCLAAFCASATTFPSWHSKNGTTIMPRSVSDANKRLSCNQSKQKATSPNALVQCIDAQNATRMASRLVENRLATTRVKKTNSAKMSCQNMKPGNVSTVSIGMPEYSTAQSKRLSTNLTYWQPYSTIAFVSNVFWHATTLLPLIMFASLVELSPIIRSRMYTVANMIADCSIATKILLAASMVFFSKCDTVQASWNLLKVSDEPSEYAQFKTLTSAQGLALFVLLLSPFDIADSNSGVGQVTATAISLIRILALQFATSLLLFPLLVAIQQLTGKRNRN